MIAAEPMRFTRILQREFLPQKRRLPVSYAPGTQNFHASLHSFALDASRWERKSRTSRHRRIHR